MATAVAEATAAAAVAVAAEAAVGEVPARAPCPVELLWGCTARWMGMMAPEEPKCFNLKKLFSPWDRFSILPTNISPYLVSVSVPPVRVHVR